MNEYLFLLSINMVISFWESFLNCPVWVCCLSICCFIFCYFSLLYIRAMSKRCMKGYEALIQIRIRLNSYNSDYFTTMLKTHSFMQQMLFEHLCCRHGSRCWSIKTELKNIPALKKLYNLMRETENKAVKYVKYIIFQKISAKDNENQEVSERDWDLLYRDQDRPP